MTEEALLNPQSDEAIALRELCTIFDVYRVAVERDALVLRALARECLKSLMRICAESQVG